jgi:hypothetical protein
MRKIMNPVPRGEPSFTKCRAPKTKEKKDRIDANAVISPPWQWSRKARLPESGSS